MTICDAKSMSEVLSAVLASVPPPSSFGLRDLVRRPRPNFKAPVPI
jgi:hypothetical protein